MWRPAVKSGLLFVSPFKWSFFQMFSDKFPHHVSELFVAFVPGAGSRVIRNSWIPWKGSSWLLSDLSSPLLSWECWPKPLFYLVIQWNSRFLQGLLQVPSFGCMLQNNPLRSEKEISRKMQETHLPVLVQTVRVMVGPEGTWGSHYVSELLTSRSDCLHHFTALCHSEHKPSLSLCERLCITWTLPNTLRSLSYFIFNCSAVMGQHWYWLGRSLRCPCFTDLRV